MQIILQKFQIFCMTISGILLDNGAGRATKVQETSAPGDPSGFSTFIHQIVSVIGDALKNIGEFLLRCLAKIAYFVAKIAMNIMDFMMVIIKQLSGQATNYSLSGNANLAESDILFQFMFNEVTVRILRAVFIFGILLLIIFTIMAIVKQEWENHINGKQNSVKKVFRKTLISIFTMLIVPFILVIGIVFSNVLLSSAMSALNKNKGTFSLGAQIFSSSSYEANRYRAYATNGQKIPIVFDYDGGFENSVTTELPQLTEDSTYAQERELNEIIESGNFTTGQSTFNMFKRENFYEFKSIADDSYYYQIYDGAFLKTKQVEYYVMADFLDFAMSSGGTFYLTNAENAYNSVMNYISLNGIPEIDITKEEKKLTDEEKVDREVYNLIFSVLDTLTAYNESDAPIIESSDIKDIEAIAEMVVSGDIVIDHINFNVYYNQGRAEGLVTEGLDTDGKIGYSSLAGSSDEVTGAKYIFCHKLELNEYGDYIYVPVRLGDQINGINFTSNFLAKAPESEDGKTTLRSETLFLARGVFTSNGYPTAIREEGQNVVFYRHDPVSPSAFNYSEIFNYQENNGGAESSNGSNFVSNFVEFISGVDISTLVPDVQINLNFLSVFTKDEVSETTLDGGKFAVNYSFVGSNLKLQHLYDELSINYVVLLFAVISLFMSLFYIIWGLIQRIFEITLLWVTMPGWIAKFPLEKDDNIGGDKTAFRGWKDRMVERVMALFSIYLALAIVLLLIPIVFQLDYITTFNIPDTNLFSIFNADIANLVIKTAFVLVLFRFLDISNAGSDAPRGAPRIIEDIILWSKTDPTKGYLEGVGKASVKEIKDLKNKAVGMFTIGGIVKNVKGLALNTARTTANAIPGKAIAERFVDHNRYQKRFEQRNDAMLARSQSNLLSKTTEADISSAATELKSATNDHSFMEGYRTAKKDYWRQTGEGLDDDFRKRGGDGTLGKVAKEGGGTVIKEDKKKKTARKINRETRRRRGV